MAHTRGSPRYRLLVLLGFCVAAAGVVVLSLSPFQTQTQNPSGSSLESGATTLTFAHMPLGPAASALLILVLLIPALFGYLRWRFYLTTLVAPTLVALAVAAWVVQGLFTPSTGSVVVSTAYGLFLGSALVLLGCALEIAGVLRTRLRRGETVNDGSPGMETTHSSPFSPR
jgi:hypothetical protein